MFRIVDIEGGGGLSDDLLCEFDCHVVGVVGVLDDSSDDKSWGYFCEHVYIIKG